MGYGLGAAGAAAFNAPAAKRAISMMGDGGFWHNGLTSGIANAVFNRSDNLTLVVDNNYTAATGGQDILSSTRRQPHAQHRPPDREGGARRRRRMGEDDPPHLRRGRHARRHPRGADDASEPGPKVLVAQSECMLNRQRREKPLVQQGHRRAASAWCASASASTPTPAPATIPASASSGCPSLDASSPTPTRCAATRWPPCSTAASAAASAARSRTPRCCARRSTARDRQQPERAGTACAQRCGSG